MDQQMILCSSGLVKSEDLLIFSVRKEKKRKLFESTSTPLL